MARMSWNISMAKVNLTSKSGRLENREEKEFSQSMQDSVVIAQLNHSLKTNLIHLQLLTLRLSSRGNWLRSKQWKKKRKETNRKHALFSENFKPNLLNQQTWWQREHTRWSTF